MSTLHALISSRSQILHDMRGQDIQADEMVALCSSADEPDLKEKHDDSEGYKMDNQGPEDMISLKKKDEDTEGTTEAAKMKDCHPECEEQTANDGSECTDEQQQDDITLKGETEGVFEDNKADEKTRVFSSSDEPRLIENQDGCEIFKMESQNPESTISFEKKDEQTADTNEAASVKDHQSECEMPSEEGDKEKTSMDSTEYHSDDQQQDDISLAMDEIGDQRQHQKGSISTIGRSSEMGREGDCCACMTHKENSHATKKMNNQSSRRKLCVPFNLKQYLHRRWITIMLVLFVSGTFAAGEEYPPVRGIPVQRGDDVNVTAVPSEECTVLLHFFKDTTTFDCRRTDLQWQVECHYNKEFKPSGCYDLTIQTGWITKQNITTKFAFCVLKACSTIVESGNVSLSWDEPSVSTTLPATSSATTTQHTPTDREIPTATETSTEDSNRVNLVSPAWRDTAIVLWCLILCFIVLGIVYCYKIWKRKTRKRKARKMNGSTKSCDSLPLNVFPRKEEAPQVNGSTKSSNGERSQERDSMLNGGSIDNRSQSAPDNGNPEGKPLRDSASSGISLQSTEEVCELNEVVTDGEISDM